MLVDVALNAPLRAGDRAFTFAVPAALAGQVRPGMAVRVPFGKQLAIGFVVAESDGAPPQVKFLSGIDDRIPPLPADLIALARWMAAHYVCSIGEALWAMMPPLTAAARRVREARPPAGGPGAVAGAGAPAVAPGDGALAAARGEAVRCAAAPEGSAQAARAPDEPAEAAERGEIAQVLDGDPASRLLVIADDERFAVYLDALRWAERRGCGVLILVPEVAQAERMLAWVRRHATPFAALVHGEMRVAERWEVWRAALAGETRVVVGTRLAVFAPLPALGLLLVDHEEDASYKEERAPRYHARRVAEERARLSGAAVIWGTPAPSVETMREAAEGRARVVRRPMRRHAVALSDVRAEAGPLGGLFGRRLYQALARTLPRGRAIVYVPRRGYADFLLCHECGWVPRCARCGVAMTYHVRQARLRCHLCGATDAAPAMCGNCRGTHLRAHGVGTERVEQAARRLFRGSSVLRLDAERAPEEVGQQRVWEQFRRRGGLLVGTQLLAKGVGQVDVDVVGVIGIDAALHLPDFRAGERVYQTLVRLAALAGREMIIQTFAPSHPALVALARGDADRFYQAELSSRQRFRYPPFCTLINAVAAGPDPDAVRDAAQAVAAGAGGGGDVLGPSPAPLGRIRGRYRWQVLIKDDEGGAARVRLAELMRTARLPRDVRVLIDVDAVELL